MEHSDAVLIIGGGVVGVCAAYYLAEKGRDVVVVDKGEIGSGASYGNAGLVLPSHAVPLAAPGVMGQGLKWMLDPASPFYIKPRLDCDLFFWLRRFMGACKADRVRRAIPLLHSLQSASLDLYEQLAALDGLEFGLNRKGMLMLFRTRHGYEEGLKEAHLLAEFGVRFKAVAGEGVRELEPSLLPGAAGGVFYPDDAHLDPAAFAVGLARVAAGKGVRFHTNTEALGLSASQGEIVSVSTTRGDFRPAEVVLAGGAWSPTLVKSLGLNLPIQAAKGYSITVKRPESCPAVPCLLGEARVAATPLGDALRFGGTLELAGLDLSINQRRVAAILSGARKYIGGLDDLETVEIWRGLRPCTPDGLPIIGRSAAYKNLTIAAGHAMIGQALGPITGKLVSQILCGEAPDADIAALRAERF